MGNDRIRGHLDTLILSVLKGGSAHGYEVVAELRRRSDGEFDLPEGTVYPALHRLERQSLLASDWEVGDGRRRRVYRLTAAGSTALAEETREWRRFAMGMNAILGSA
ncbi:MAG: transcriptional regulator, PadR-like family [Marmoricola sp.]|nr:transcriptional regulator, PadR-like family [Marmoricola sp.]